MDMATYRADLDDYVEPYGDDWQDGPFLVVVNIGGVRFSKQCATEVEANEYADAMRAAQCFPHRADVFAWDTRAADDKPYLRKLDRP